MCTDFLRYAKGDYQLVCLTENNYEIENWAGMCCYHLQQAIEKVLKYCIGHLGGVYNHTHNLSRLYSQYLDLGGSEIPNMSMYSNVITSWEANSRYEGDGVNITQTDLNIAKAIYQDLRNVAEEINSFNATEFLKQYYGDKFKFLSETAVANCTTENDCLNLIEQLKGVLPI